MKRKTIILFIALIFLCSNFSIELHAKKKSVIALVGGTLIDGTGSSPIEDITILIEDDKIKVIGPKNEVNIPEEAKKIYVSGKWVLPGFIDLHIHLTYPTSTEMYYDDSGSLQTIRALHVMNKYLPTGVTSVRDVSSDLEAMKALKRAETLGLTNTIRLFSVGEGIVSTGGHGEMLSATQAADGPDEWRKAVRKMKKAGFGYIKILPPYTVEEVIAAVDEAKTQGMLIMSHCGSDLDFETPYMSRRAVENGVQCIEHMNKIEDEVLEMMAEKGVHLVPTVGIIKHIRKLYGNRELPERMVPLETYEGSFKKAKSLGIVMGIGTDFVGPMTKMYPKPYFMEMKYFVELGMSPMETIVCATKNGGIILGKEDQLGTIEPGKLADIQVIRGNPLESFDVLASPEIVIIGGKIHHFPENQPRKNR
ncbi:MAG: amidohydrolase family protein [Candidatus Aminicenantes bacterium]|nr:MAG: amidohydrolase family protein [Candidatus Aminicenantes bacterium]